MSPSLLIAVALALQGSSSDPSPCEGLIVRAEIFSSDLEPSGGDWQEERLEALRGKLFSNETAKTLALAKEFVALTKADTFDRGLALVYLGIALADVKLLKEAHAKASEGMQILAKTTKEKALGQGYALHLMGSKMSEFDRLDAAKIAIGGSIAIRSKHNPDIRTVAVLYANLADIEMKLKDVDAAIGHYQRSLQEFKKDSRSNKATVGRTHCKLGSALFDKGDLVNAQLQLVIGTEIWERAEPWSIEAAKALDELGKVAAARGDNETAQQAYGRANVIRIRLGEKPQESAGHIVWPG